jgi:hypothetical protein
LARAMNWRNPCSKSALTYLKVSSEDGEESHPFITRERDVCSLIIPHSPHVIADSAYVTEAAIAQISPFHSVVKQIRQNSSAGCSTLVEADGLNNGDTAHLASMCNPDEGAGTSNPSAELLSGTAGVQDLSKHLRQSRSVPRHPRNPHSDKHPGFPLATVRSHSRHQSTRLRTYGLRHNQQQYIALSKEPTPVFDIYKDGIKQLSELLERGAITSTGVVNIYLRQIDKHNETLRALVHLAPREDVYRLAKQRDLERRLGKCRGPLHGIPLVIK